LPDFRGDASQGGDKEMTKDRNSSQAKQSFLRRVFQGTSLKPAWIGDLQRMCLKSGVNIGAPGSPSVERPWARLTEEEVAHGLGHSRQRQRSVAISVALLNTALAACTQAPDMSAIQSENGKAIKRYDINQTVVSNGKVVAVGTQSGAVLVSKDHGKNWIRTQLGQVSLVDMTVCPDGSLLAIDHYHKVWTSNAEGSQWTSAALDKPRTPLAVTCDPQGRWWVVGTAATIAGSSDRGASWQLTELGKDVQLTTIQFVDESHALATGEFGMVVGSNDAGVTWKLVGTMPNEFYPYATLFTNLNEGWSSGIAGQILHTTDGGRTWTKQNNTTQAPLYRLFAHEGHTYGVGAGGVVATYDGGVWRQLPYPDPVPVFLGAGASLPGQAALIAGGPGGLLRVVSTQTTQSGRP